VPETSLDGARALGERIRKAVARADLLEGCPTRTSAERVTISVGIASGKKGQEELVACADAALYAAKRAGRNRSSVA
jgi:diguanylate cyclase (GGDEF)-like protein